MGSWNSGKTLVLGVFYLGVLTSLWKFHLFEFTMTMKILLSVLAPLAMAVPLYIHEK